MDVNEIYSRWREFLDREHGAELRMQVRDMIISGIGLPTIDPLQVYSVPPVEGPLEPFHARDRMEVRERQARFRSFYRGDYKGRYRREGHLPMILVKDLPE